MGRMLLGLCVACLVMVMCTFEAKAQDINQPAIVPIQQVDAGTIYLAELAVPRVTRSVSVFAASPGAVRQVSTVTYSAVYSESTYAASRRHERRASRLHNRQARFATRLAESPRIELLSVS